LSNARGAIVHLDEVLTMSAMMAAVTGEVVWIERYKKFELELTAAIEAALAVARSRAVALAIDETGVANTELVKMEYQSFKSSAGAVAVT
jgi:predicted histidine transporter YuiF (NhaC family)